MNLAGIQRSALILGGAIAGGAVIGGGLGAISSLKSEGTDNQLSRQEKRDTLANVIIGAGAGAAAGVALLGGKHFVPKLNALPILGSMGIAPTIGLGLGVGAAGYGAFSLASHALD
jgi:hypothetical protein